MTFEEWFDEREGYATRGERFGDDWVLAKSGVAMGKDWLLAAYNAGYKHAASQYSLSNLRKRDDATDGAPTPPYVKYPNPMPSPFMPNPWPQDTVSCGKCGMNLSGVMGYVCNDRGCPTFLRPQSVTSTSSSLSGVHGYSEGVGMGEIK